jgi:hypothetical protein
MPYDAGGNGARARSARIRTSHDYEATHLEEMRRRSVRVAPQPERGSILSRLSAPFRRVPPRNAEVGATEAIASVGHVAFAGDPPRGSHGQETDAPAATTPAAYSRAVTQVCAHARLFEEPHSIGTRAGAHAVAGDIRAATQRRLVLVKTVPAPPSQRPVVVRWVALERSLADAYALNYVRIYDLIAAPRAPRQAMGAARRLAAGRRV